MAVACVMLPDTQVMHDCAGLNAEGSCSSPCSTSHVGKSAIRDSVVLLSSPARKAILLIPAVYFLAQTLFLPSIQQSPEPLITRGFRFECLSFGLAR